MATNPFEANSARTAATAASAAFLSSKALADEVRRDDAAMAEDLMALAPRNRTPATATTSGTLGSNSRGPTLRSGTATSKAASTNAEAAAGVAASRTRATEDTTTEAYIAKTREVGLVRMSLQAKKSEIRKLEADIDRAEKRLRQRQEQLNSTRERFNSFLKYSNLEQDAAVRRADSESKAKQERVVEIKKLSAHINHVELDIRKSQLQLESCRAYKKFLDNLAKPRWFYDVLSELRVADRTEEILLETEDTFEARSRELEVAYAQAAADLAETFARRERKSGGAAGGPGSAMDADQPLPEVIPLDVQIAELESSLAVEAQHRVEAAAEAIRAEVDDLTVDEVRDVLERDYDETRIPLYFKDVDELLEVFINVEEGNLFLIQNCQELEEELEAVAMAHLTERTDTQTMATQRHAQMSALKDKIAAAQAKLKQLEDRAGGLERHTSAATGAEAGAYGAAGAAAAAGSSNNSGKNAAAAATAVMTPETYRDLMESSITRAFRTLSAGETTIKQLTSQLQRMRQRASEAESGELGTAAASAAVPAAGATTSPEEEARRGVSANSKRAGTASLKGTMTGGQDTMRSFTGGGGNASRSGKKMRRAGGDGAASGNAATAPGTSNNASGGGGGDAGANMGAVELLTLIENKLQEYYRYLTDPANGVDDALIIAVMKASDKARRQLARQEHMARQAEEHEERARKALERSQAPVVRSAGKAVLRRSCLKRDGQGVEGGVSEGKSKRAAGARASRAIDDGAEFFT